MGTSRTPRAGDMKRCSGLSSNPGQQDNSGFPGLRSKSSNPMKSAWKPFVLDDGYRGLEAFPNHPCFQVQLPIIKCGARLGGYLFRAFGKTWGFSIIKLGMSPCELLRFQDNSSFQPL